MSALLFVCLSLILPNCMSETLPVPLNKVKNIFMSVPEMYHICPRYVLEKGTRNVMEIFQNGLKNVSLMSKKIKKYPRSMQKMSKKFSRDFKEMSKKYPTNVNNNFFLIPKMT